MPARLSLLLGPGIAAALAVRPLSGQAAEPAPLRLLCPAAEVRCFEVLELELRGLEPSSDPWDPAEVDAAAVFRAAGQTWRVPAFFGQDYERRRVGGRDWFYPRGEPGWKVRFAPTRVGEFTATAEVRDARGVHRSEPIRFTSLPPTRPGFLRVSRADPRWLEFSDGTPFFAVGQNLAFIGSEQYFTLSRAEEAFARLATNGANYLRVWTCCGDWALAIEAPKSAWGRSWEGRAPIVPMPGEPGRRCVWLTNTLTAVRPSHAVALRPATSYQVTGRVRAGAGVAVRLEVQGTTSPNLAPATPEAWAPFQHQFTTGPEDFWLREMGFRLDGPGEAWLADLSLQEVGGGPELLWEAEVNRPARGWYNPLDCFWLDELLVAAQRHGLYLQLCLLTRDLYMAALKDPKSPAYDRAIADAQKTLRYAVARWGAFTSVAAWEYWNEMDPGLPTDRFYTELGEFLERTDPWQHLRSTSTWGPSPKDCQHPKLDMADVHFYYRPADHARLRDEVEAILDRARWLRTHAPNKPALQGECGLADDQWRITDEMKRSRELVDFHNMLWASALSGTSGTALAWWWERLDQRNHYPHYRPLSRFLADVPWTGGELQAFTDETAGGAVRVVGLKTRRAAWVWCFHRAAAWKHVVTAGQTPGPVRGASIILDALADGDCRLEWWDARSGEVLEAAPARVRDGRLAVVVPEFTHDLALKVGR